MIQVSWTVEAIDDLVHSGEIDEETGHMARQVWLDLVTATDGRVQPFHAKNWHGMIQMNKLLDGGILEAGIDSQSCTWLYIPLRENAIATEHEYVPGCPLPDSVLSLLAKCYPAPTLNNPTVK